MGGGGRGEDSAEDTQLYSSDLFRRRGAPGNETPKRRRHQSLSTIPSHDKLPPKSLELAQLRRSSGEASRSTIRRQEERYQFTLKQ
jgi:hypothetical protein